MLSSAIKHQLTLAATFALLLTLALPIAAQAQSSNRSRNTSAAATNITITSTSGWQQTGMTVQQGTQFMISYVSGTWTVDVNNYPFVGPNGYPPNIDKQIYQGCKYDSSLVYAMLLGQIGNGPDFVIGQGGTFTASASGILSMRINDDDACLGDNAGSIVLTGTGTVPLGGTWISPGHNFTVNGDTLTFSAHAYGGAGVSYVNFTAYWPGVWHHVWYIACTVNPAPGTDVFTCNWTLPPSVPNGNITVSFDVYDQAGNKHLSPNGTLPGVIHRPVHSELLAPMPSGTTLKIVHGYNDPLPGQFCPKPGPNRRDHCMNQAFGLDFVPTNSATDIIAPASGTVAWLISDCLGLRLDLGDVNLNICHFATFNVKQGDYVARGKFLGTWVGNIHLSIDDRYHDKSPGSGCPSPALRNCRPVPFNAGYYTIEGMSFDPGFDQNGNPIQNQWYGSTIVSTNVETK